MKTTINTPQINQEKSNKNIEHKTFKLQDLSNENFGKAKLKHVTFNHSILKQTNFIGATLENCTFIGSDLTKANFTGAQLVNCTFTDSILTETNFTGTTLEDSHFKRPYGKKVNFESSDIINLEIEDSRLSEAIFNNAQIDEVNLDNLDQTNSSFINTTIHDSCSGDRPEVTIDLKRSHATNPHRTKISVINDPQLKSQEFNHAILEITEKKETIQINRKQINQTTFEGGNFKLFRLWNSEIINSKMKNSNIEKCSITGAINNFLFDNCTFGTLSLRGIQGPIDLSTTAMSKLVLRGETETSNVILGRNIQELDLDGIEVSRIQGLEEKDSLTNSTIINSDLSNLDLSNKDLSGINLSGSNLSNVNLQGANLTGANLTDTILTGADLTNANLPNLDLSNKDLTGVNLSGSNLSNVNLQGAHLDGTDLTDTVLTGANLTETILGQPYKCQSLWSKNCKHRL